MPFCIMPMMIAYRKSWFEEVGATQFPATWEEYREHRQKTEGAKGRPIGQALLHNLTNGPAFLYPFLWSWGGKEVDETGKTVLINSKETIESIKFMTDFWKDAFDERGLSWDDSKNYETFLEQDTSATLDGGSLYLQSLRRPPLKDDVLQAPLPRGPGGPFALHNQQSHMVMSYSKHPQTCQGTTQVIHPRCQLRQVAQSQERHGERHDDGLGGEPEYGSRIPL